MKLGTAIILLLIIEKGSSTNIKSTHFTETLLNPREKWIVM